LKKVEALTRPNAAMANFSTFRLLWNCASTAHASRSKVHHIAISQIKDLPARDLVRTRQTDVSVTSFSYHSFSGTVLDSMNSRPVKRIE
jgi:hypothetical protein